MASLSPGAGCTQKAAQIFKPNLSGEWLLEAQTDTRGNLVRPPLSLEVRLEISHHDPELKITRSRTTNGDKETEESTYYTDGRGEKNQSAGLTTKPGVGRKVQITSDTRWKKEKLVVRGSFRQVLAGRSHEVKKQDEWKLSADGKTLTQATTLRFGDGIFDLQSAVRRQAIIISPGPVRSRRIYRRY